MIDLGHVQMNARQIRAVTDANSWRYRDGGPVARRSEQEPGAHRFTVRSGDEVRIVFDMATSSFAIETEDDRARPVAYPGRTSVWTTVATGTFRRPQMTVDDRDTVRGIDFAPRSMEALATRIEEQYRSAVHEAVLALPFESPDGFRVESLGRAAQIAAYAARRCRVFSRTTDWLLFPFRGSGGSTVMCVYPGWHHGASGWLPRPYGTETVVDWPTVWNGSLGPTEPACELLRPSAPVPIAGITSVGRYADDQSSARERIDAVREPAVVEYFLEKLSKFFTVD